jgi:hypothetical protein
MQVILSKPVIGFYKDDEGNSKSRMHAEEGDTLDVILRNETHFICDSLFYSDTAIAVFPSQCTEVVVKEEPQDEYAEERYYHVYSKPEKQIKPSYDLFDSDESEY